MQQHEEHGVGAEAPRRIAASAATEVLKLAAGWAGEWWAREHASGAKDPAKFGAEVRAVCLAVMGAGQEGGASRGGRESVFIGIDVQADGVLVITLWRGQQRNAAYVGMNAAKALDRALPQAIEEAIALAQFAGAESADS